MEWTALASLAELAEPRRAAFGESFLLRFALPPTLQLCVGRGRWQPCIHQARVDVGDGGVVEIRAFNGSTIAAQRIVFEQARKFLLTIAGGERRMPRESFTAILVKMSEPERHQHFAIVTCAAVSITHAYESPAVVA